MNIKKFVTHIVKRVYEFKSYWEYKQCREGRDNYPDELSPEEWFEQFLAFIEG